MATTVTIDDLRPWTELRFDRASGPGGQNVNKVATKATLAFDLGGCTLFTPVQHARLLERFAPRLTNDDRLLVVRQAGRTQLANRAAAEEELVRLLTAALRPPKPRRATKPSRASRERRLKAKRQAGERKRLRRGPSAE